MILDTGVSSKEAEVGTAALEVGSGFAGLEGSRGCLYVGGEVLHVAVVGRVVNAGHGRRIQESRHLRAWRGGGRVAVLLGVC